MGPQIWNDDATSGLVLIPDKSEVPKIIITDSGKKCEYTGCKCICYHVHDEEIEFRSVMIKPTKKCGAH